MRSGYEVYWASSAKEELVRTLDNLNRNWSKKEVSKLVKELDRYIEILSKTPELFALIDDYELVRKVNILKVNTLYYKIINSKVEILSFFSYRQSPSRLNI